MFKDQTELINPYSWYSFSSRPCRFTHVSSTTVNCNSLFYDIYLNKVWWEDFHICILNILDFVNIV